MPIGVSACPMAAFIGFYESHKLPPSSDALGIVLEECGMHTIGHYIDVRWETIVKYVVGRSIFAECQGADRRRGSVPRRWWWEQRMCLDDV